MITGACDACSKKRKLKEVGDYKFDGKTFRLRFCQWCRAAATRRKNARLPEPFWTKKGYK